MIQANELRLGNYIKTDDDIICIVSRIETKDYTNWNSGENFSITALELNTKDDYLNIRFDKWKPIPLTEEILLKCGINSDGLLYEFRCSEYVLKFDFEYVWIYDVELKSSICVKCEYLHQLQNIIFVLNNKELNITL